MRLSSVIVFSAFVLLASTSPIDGYNRMTNSLWRRITGNSNEGGGSHHTQGRSNELSEQRSQEVGGHHNRGPRDGPRRQSTPPPPIDNRDPHIVTLIRPDAVQNGVIVSSVTFLNGRSEDFQFTSTVPWEGPPTAQQDGPSGQHTHYTFDDIPYTDGFSGRTYRENGQLLMTILFHDRRWTVFYSPWEQSNGQPPDHATYTTREFLETHGRVREFIQIFFAPDGGHVLSFHRLFNGRWSTLYPGPIQWQDLPPDPAQHH